MSSLNHFCSVQRIFFPSLNHYPPLVLREVDFFKPEGKKRDDEKGALFMYSSGSSSVLSLRDKIVKGPREGDWHREQQGE